MEYRKRLNRLMQSQDPCTPAFGASERHIVHASTEVSGCSGLWYGPAFSETQTTTVSCTGNYPQEPCKVWEDVSNYNLRTTGRLPWVPRSGSREVVEIECWSTPLTSQTMEWRFPGTPQASASGKTAAKPYARNSSTVRTGHSQPVRTTSWARRSTIWEIFSI